MKLIDQQIIEAATWIEKVNPDFYKNFFRSPEIKPQGAIFPDAEYGKLSLENFKSTIVQRRSILGDLGVEYFVTIRLRKPLFCNAKYFRYQSFDNIIS